MMEKVQRLRRQRKVNIPSMLPIVELVGQGRLLIENHQGVLSYSTEEIKIKVCYGCVIITGEKLQLMEIHYQTIRHYKQKWKPPVLFRAELVA